MSFSESRLSNWNFCWVYAAGLSEPLSHYYKCLVSEPYGRHLIHISSHHIFYASTLLSQIFNRESSVEFLLSIFFHLRISILCNTIIMFNLIIASLPRSRILDFTQRSTLYYIIANRSNLDMKMRPCPAAHPHQQEKKTRKYYMYVINSRET